jgi:oligoribonuclease NrnB/cAMP/cGMP phosphodiesterase (DHH superfamily)
MKLSRFYIYTHRRDPDGICSGAIMKRYCEKNNFENMLDFASYGPPFEETLDDMKSIPPNSKIVFADFSIDEEQVEKTYSVFSELLKNECEIYWYDHHNWNRKAEKVSKMLTKFVLDKSLCGAELVQKEYMPKDRVSLALAKIARDHDIDVWKYNVPRPSYALTFPLSDIITYYNYLGREDRSFRRKLLNELVNFLANSKPKQLLRSSSKKPHLNHKLENDLEFYTKEKALKLKECLNTSILYNIKNYKVVLGRADEMLPSSDTGRYLLSNTDADLSVVVYPKGTLSFRRNNPTILCDEIARVFGGGGHEAAAGAHLNYELKSEEDFEKARSEIIKKLRNYLRN